MKEYKFNTNNNFIDGYYLNDLSVCDNLIKLFESSNKKTEGTIRKGVNKKIKDSLDVSLDINDIKSHQTLQNYFNQLFNCLELYKTKYKFCDEIIAPWGLEKNFNIQKYKPTQAYHGWHCETTSPKSSHRHLVWMTYLNDVKQGGETEWYFQKLKVKPEKGLTVIWSADWTFTHKGHTTINEDKYIITGWFSYI